MSIIKKMIKYIQGRDRIHKEIAVVPIVMAGVFAFSVIGGLVSVYGKGEKAAASLKAYKAATGEINASALSARKRISRDVDSEGNYIYSDRVLYGSITTSDQASLFNPFEEDCCGPAWNGLIGNLNNVAGSGEFNRYFLSNYMEDLFGEVEYDLLNGFYIKENNQLMMTLSYRVQEALYEYMSEKGIDGSITVCDIQTGDLVAMCSSPGAEWEDAEHAESGSYINKSLYSYQPGSTDKLLICYLLMKQGYDLENLIFNCEGTYHLKADGTSINCTGVHGTINGVEGLGNSCNCWFSQAVELLDSDETKKELEKLGFYVNSTQIKYLGKIPRSGSSYFISDEWDFSSVQGLIGEDRSVVSPIDYVYFLGCIASEGTAIEPRILQTDDQRQNSYYVENSKVFKELKDLWYNMFDQYYEGYSDHIVACKTGTVSGLGSDRSRTQRILAGITDNDMAFYIIIENWDSSRDSFETISSYLVDLLLENG